MREDRLKGCTVDKKKQRKTLERGSMDYRVDKNSGMIVVKWVDNDVASLASNFVGVHPIGTIQRWDKTENAIKEIPCPYIVAQYNKSMGGVDLADMLIALYRISVKSKRWCIKVF